MFLYVWIFVYVGYGIVGKYVSEESKGKNIRKKIMLFISIMLCINYEFSLYFISR